VTHPPFTKIRAINLPDHNPRSPTPTVWQPARPLLRCGNAWQTPSPRGCEAALHVTWRRAGKAVVA
jgi:hypothetical protein